MPKNTAELLNELQEIQASIVPPETPYDSVVEIDIASPTLFKELCAYSINVFTPAARVEMKLNGTVYGVLKCTEKEPKHPYCYPSEPKTCTKLLMVRYNDIGEQLSHYKPDAIDMLLTVALKILKLKHTQADLDSLNILCSPSLFPSINNNTECWHPISLLAVLVGSGACETGRGVVGYVNIVAAFHHLKHDARSAWTTWALTSGEDLPDSTIGEILKSGRDITDDDPKAISPAVAGSATYIKQHSGNSDETSKTTKAWNKNKPHKQKYATLTERDLTLLSEWQPRNYAYTVRIPTEKAGEIFERKVNHYLRLIFPNK